MISIQYKKVHSYPELSEESLNHYGADGWELCGIDHNESVYIFKRPIPRRGKRVKVTDTDNSEILYFPTMFSASEHLGTSCAALRYSLVHNTLYLKRYKVESDEQ